MMKDILEPILRRVGTFSAGLLVSYGVEAELASTAVVAVSALVLVGLDLLMSKAERGRYGN